MLALPPAPQAGDGWAGFQPSGCGLLETPAAPGQAACRHEEEPGWRGGASTAAPHSRGKQSQTRESKFPQTRGILRNRSRPMVLPFCSKETRALIRMRIKADSE